MIFEGKNFSSLKPNSWLFLRKFGKDNIRKSLLSSSRCQNLRSKKLNDTNSKKRNFQNSKLQLSCRSGKPSRLEWSNSKR
nr:MAG TPA: hypothetical protein [Caudoviricetes sp.]